jgi:glycogen debranching enzyme
MLWAAIDSTYSAWCGPSLLVATRRGECGDGVRLTGYYFRETRHLRTLRLTVNGRPAWWCGGGAVAQDRLSLTFVYPELIQENGGGAAGGTGTGKDEVQRDDQGLPRRALEIGIDLEVRVASLLVSVTLANRAREPLALELTWVVDADFADLQEAERAVVAAVDASVDADRIEFRPANGSAQLATTVVARGAAAWRASAGSITAQVDAPPGEVLAFGLEVVPHDPAGVPDPAGIAARERTVRRWRRRLARAAGPAADRFSELVNRSMDDLGSLSLLEGEPDEWLAPAAGVPMYPALFGRDALTAAWQAAALDRGEMLDATLTRLRRLQGNTVDPARDEQPGRIVQQVRRGPLARRGQTPFDRYYGDVASPFMFVIALAQLYAWNGDRRTLRRHWDAARRVLDWARDYGDADGDGYVEYRTLAPEGPTHQGWKDSGDAIVGEEGDRVPAPIAAAEVQGYWFAAQQLAAVLAAVLGARHDALDYWRAAWDLKRRFNRDFWMPELGYVALALGVAPGAHVDAPNSLSGQPAQSAPLRPGMGTPGAWARTARP